MVGEGGWLERGGVVGEGRGGLRGEGCLAEGGVVTFQSVDRCTHECSGFLSQQWHLDGRLRDHQSPKMSLLVDVLTYFLIGRSYAPFPLVRSIHHSAFHVLRRFSFCKKLCSLPSALQS